VYWFKKVAPQLKSVAQVKKTGDLSRKGYWFVGEWCIGYWSLVYWLVVIGYWCIGLRK
jgi:hypothetical protein